MRARTQSPQIRTKAWHPNSCPEVRWFARLVCTRLPVQSRSRYGMIRPQIDSCPLSEGSPRSRPVTASKPRPLRLNRPHRPLLNSFDNLSRPFQITHPQRGRSPRVRARAHSIHQALGHPPARVVSRCHPGCHPNSSALDSAGPLRRQRENCRRLRPVRQSGERSRIHGRATPTGAQGPVPALH